MKALVLAPVTINGTPAKAGDSVEVDSNTFANLARKGKLAAPKAAASSKSEPKESEDSASENRDPESENREQSINLKKRK